jgi:hypothetical protein
MRNRSELHTRSPRPFLKRYIAIVASWEFGTEASRWTSRRDWMEICRSARSAAGYCPASFDQLDLIV